MVTIAEESTAWPGVTRPTDAGGLGFGLKWNMGWMHDTLATCRGAGAPQLPPPPVTFSMIYAFSENYVLPISHDEVVHGKGSLLWKMPGDRWQKLADLRAYLAHVGPPGQAAAVHGPEFGQDAGVVRVRSLDWWLLDHPVAPRRGCTTWSAQLNRTLRRQPGALWEQDDSTPERASRSL